MSYILDALRKAEADKEQDPRANLAVNQQQPQRHSWGLYLIAVALIGNLTVLVWLFGPWDKAPAEKSGTTATPETITLPPATGSTTADPATPQPQAQLQQPAAPQQQRPVAQPAAAVPATTEATLPDSSPAAAAPAPQQPPAAREPVHTNLAGLSPGARARFPELSFSTHVFAADPELRAVVVNGERLREGDRLGNLQLANITETGVVFRFEDYFVTVSVLDDWD